MRTSYMDGPLGKLGSDSYCVSVGMTRRFTDRRRPHHQVGIGVAAQNDGSGQPWKLGIEGRRAACEAKLT